jgi:hypothetical protein
MPQVLNTGKTLRGLNDSMDSGRSHSFGIFAWRSACTLCRLFSILILVRIASQTPPRILAHRSSYCSDLFPRGFHFRDRKFSPVRRLMRASVRYQRCVEDVTMKRFCQGRPDRAFSAVLAVETLENALWNPATASMRDIPQTFLAADCMTDESLIAEMRVN